MDEFQNFVGNRRINHGHRTYKELNDHYFQLKQGSSLTLLPIIQQDKKAKSLEAR